MVCARLLGNQWSNSCTFSASYTARIYWPISFGGGANYEAVATGSVYGADATYDNTNNMIYNAKTPVQCDFRTNHSDAPSLRGIAIGV